MKAEVTGEYPSNDVLPNDSYKRIADYLMLQRNRPDPIHCFHPRIAYKGCQ